MRKTSAIYALIDCVLGIYLLILLKNGDNTRYSRTDPAQKVKAFTTICLLPFLLLKIVAILCCKSPSTAKLHIFGIYLPQVILYALWSIWVLISLTLIDRNQPINAALATMILLLIFFGNTIYGVFLMIPLFLYQTYNSIKAEVEQSNLNIAQIKCLPEVPYDPSIFKAYSFCTICMEEFTKDSRVTYLPCDSRHYFDTQCITYWLCKQTTCPLCKAEVDYEKAKQSLSR